MWIVVKIKLRNCLRDVVFIVSDNNGQFLNHNQALIYIFKRILNAGI